MPVAQLVVRDVGFQSAKTFIPYVDPDPARNYIDFLMQSISAEMQFVNDGYTIVYVVNPFDEPLVEGENDLEITFKCIPDNAGRIEDLVERVPWTSSAICGPFRPIWWNYGGKVEISAAFAVAGGAQDITDASIAAFSLQF